jgi:hypothetical protein
MHMRYLRFAIIGCFLFVLTATPAPANAPVQTDPAQSTVSLAKKEGIQLAQRGRCRAFGQMNKCRPVWDRRSKSCVCPGAT